MLHVAQFFWGWLLASLLLGFAMGWISVVQRTGVEGIWGRALWALVGVLAALAISSVVPGRAGFWLDLWMAMFGLYLIGCALGSWLRAWVIGRSSPPG